MTQGFDIIEMERRAHEWDRRFLLLATHVSSWSKDPSTQVGCVIVDENRRVVAMGYNGFPRAVNDTPERYADRDQKYPRIVHAEMNAILNTGTPMALEDCVLYCSLPPCCECAKAIIQVGIYRVVLPRSTDAETAKRWEQSMEVTMDMFLEAGVEVDYR